MARLNGKRERKKFRMEFDSNGQISKFSTQEKPDCCQSCAGSDQVAVVHDASPNAKHLLGTCQARDKFLKADTKESFTVGEGWIEGVLVRDIC